MSYVSVTRSLHYKPSTIYQLHSGMNTLLVFAEQRDALLRAQHSRCYFSSPCSQAGFCVISYPDPNV